MKRIILVAVCALMLSTNLAFAYTVTRSPSVFRVPTRTYVPSYTPTRVYTPPAPRPSYFQGSYTPVGSRISPIYTPTHSTWNPFNNFFLWYWIFGSNHNQPIIKISSTSNATTTHGKW